MSAMRSIFWFREDLRLKDNPGLIAALSDQKACICVYILDETLPQGRKLGGASRWWLNKSLLALSQSIALRGGQLVLKRGDSLTRLKELAFELDAAEVHWNRRYGEAERKQDEQIKTALKDAGYKATSHPGNVLTEPWILKTGSGGPYRVFSPYWRALKAKNEATQGPEAPKQLPETEPLSSDNLPDWNLHPQTPDWSEGLESEWTPGEDGAAVRLEAFLNGPANTYPDDRNRPDKEATSRLSPHLRFGEISPRQVWNATKAALNSDAIAEKPADKFLSEIAWREFSYHLLYHYPHIDRANYSEKFNDFPWNDHPIALSKWQKGQTGYPIVDAGMRELWATGYMHNRVRMIVASFLTKHLLIHWKHGENWFWDTLVDADPANNAASWQWTAGSGADAAPYFRIFNPISQGEKFDPNGDYVRRWVPELSRLSNAHIHHPWDASLLELKAADVELGKTYPSPMVDHGRARQAALDAYETMKSNALSS